MAIYEVRVIKPIEGCECGLMDVVFDGMLKAKDREDLLLTIGALASKAEIELTEETEIIIEKKDTIKESTFTTVNFNTPVYGRVE